MKRISTLFTALLLVITSVNAQLVIKNDQLFNTADQMLLANELFLSGEPFAEDLGYNLDDLDPMVPNLPDSISYATGIEGYEYSRYLLGVVVSRSGIGLHMMWAPVLGQMAAMQPDSIDGKYTGGTANGFKQDDEMMHMMMHFGMLANQMAPAHAFPQFAEFESGNPQLPQTVAPNFAMDFASLRWDRSQFSKVLNPAAMGQTLLKQYYWAQDMLGAFHDADDNGIDADGVVSPDSVGSPNFDPNNNVFYGGNNLDGFIGQVLTAESINKVAFVLNKMAYNGSSLGMVDPATYDPANGIIYIPHRVAVTEGMVHETMPPKPMSFEVLDASSQLFDQVSLLLGTLNFKNMMNPSINDAAHFAYHDVFDGNPFPAAKSQSGTKGPYDMMAGASMVLVKNLLAMHFNQEEGTFVDVSNLNGGAVSMGTEVTSTNLGYILLALSKAATEFAGTPLEQMTKDALNAQANFVLSKLKNEDNGYANGYTVGTGATTTAKTAVAQAAIAHGLYAAYQLTNNTDYLNGANAAYQYLINNFYVSEESVFRTEKGNNTSTFTPKNLAILSGGLREAAIVGNQADAAAIYVRFFTKIYNPMLLAEAEPSGETGNDSDGDGIPYEAGGTVATVFADLAEYTTSITGVEEELRARADLIIYPNPVSNRATVTFKNDRFQQAGITILNIAGQTVQHLDMRNNRNIEWNVQNIENGIYFVRLETNGIPVAVQKVIVNK